MSSRQEAFWKQPFWLSDTFERGELSEFQFTLVCYLGGKGLEYRGVQATLGQLARTFGKTEKWIKRTLGVLRDEARLIEFDLKQGQRRPFVITAGPTLREGVSALYFKPTSEVTSEVGEEACPDTATSAPTSEVTSVSQFRGDLGSDVARDAARSQAGSELAERATSELSRGRVDVDQITTNPSPNEVRPTTRQGEGTLDETEALLAALQVDVTPTRFLPPVISAARVGEIGFVHFAKTMHAAGVVDHEELLAWLAFHGAVIRATYVPLDTGEGIADETLSALTEALR